MSKRLALHHGVADAPVEGRILLAHGGGGALTRELIDDVIAPALRQQEGPLLGEPVVVETQARTLAFVTTSFAARQLFFRGGDLGRLAVTGTVNALASRGARAAHLALGLFLEEGLRIAELTRLLESAFDAAQEAGVRIAVGDTRVVEPGVVKQALVHATGIGWIEGDPLHARRIQAGDVIVLTGTLGDHGIAMLGQADGLRVGGDVASDVAPVASLVLGLRLAGVELHAAHDLSRGGLAAALHELCTSGDLTAVVDEDTLPARSQVRQACDLLGLDLLTVANEGNLVLVLPAAQADAAVQWLRSQPHGGNAVRVGSIATKRRQRVLLRTCAGGERIVPMPRGEQLPRIR